MKSSLWEAEFLKAFRDSYRHFLERSGRKAAVRSFAELVGMAPGTVSQLLSGKRDWKLTPERAKGVLLKLQLEEREVNRILSLMGEAGAWKKELLKSEDFPLLTNWIYQAVLFSFDLSDTEKTLQKISSKLGVSIEDVEAAVTHLTARGMLERGPDGAFSRKEVFYTSSDEIPDETVLQAHRVTLQVAEKALSKVPSRERDFTSLTFTGSPEKVALLKKEIRKLYDLALGLMSAEEPEGREVFRLSVNLFPMNFMERTEHER